MKRFQWAVASGAIVAASFAPAFAASWGFGISYGPAPYYGYGWPGPVYYPRAYYGPRYAYPRYYGYYGYPVYGPPAYYAYAYPPAPPPRYVERYIEMPPPPQARPAPPRAESSRPPKPSAPLAATPPQRFEKMTLSATELFDFDKDTLRLPQPKLDEIARALKENPGIGSVAINGYTDRLGDEAYNLALSQRRAAAVKSYLVGQGVDRDRLNAIGHGEANPVVQCNQKDQQALIRCLEPNRRVEVQQITVEKKVEPRAAAPAGSRGPGT